MQYQALTLYTDPATWAWLASRAQATGQTVGELILSAVAETQIAERRAARRRAQHAQHVRIGYRRCEACQQRPHWRLRGGLCERCHADTRRLREGA